MKMKNTTLKFEIRKPFLLLLLLGLSIVATAQTSNQIINKVNQHFARVNDYSASIQMQFNIPSVRLENIEGKVFYKRPNKFRIKTQGIVFLPKQNPYFAVMALFDTTSYTTIMGGDEKINGTNTTIITILPHAEADLIVGKFWIDKTQSIILKSQLTTRTNGTIQIENFYTSNINFALPEKMIFTVDVSKFKVPKAIAVDLNSKTKTTHSASKKGIGTIQFSFSNYQINKKFSDAVFTD
jgi:hypothetical protein